MANRSYLYSLSNRPTSYSDRPETISGLSEWAYFVPFSYRVLTSGDPEMGASLVSDGFEEEPPERKTRLHAITGDFETGYARLQKFLAIVRAVAGSTAPNLVQAIDETNEFLRAHRNRFVLLETVELDTMTEGTEQALRACVERELAACRGAGAAIDALPADVKEAAAVLKAAATRKQAAPPLDAFFGLVLDDNCDSSRDGHTEYPLGLYWEEVLYFQLWNREQFEANG